MKKQEWKDLRDLGEISEAIKKHGIESVVISTLITVLPILDDRLKEICNSIDKLTLTIDNLTVIDHR